MATDANDRADIEEEEGIWAGGAEQLIDDILESYRNELMPGAVEEMKKQWTNDRGADRSPGKMIAFLESEEGAAYRNPEVDPPATRSMVKRVLGKFPILRSSVDTLAAEWGLELQKTGDVARMAEKIASRLGRPENERHLRHDRRRPMGHKAQKVYAVLEHFSWALDRNADLEGVAKKWGVELGHQSPGRIAKAVADRLTMPWHARDLTRTGEPLDKSDIDYGSDIFAERKPTREELDEDLRRCGLNPADYGM